MRSRIARSSMLLVLLAKPAGVAQTKATCRGRTRVDDLVIDQKCLICRVPRLVRGTQHNGIHQPGHPAGYGCSWSFNFSQLNEFEIPKIVAPDDHVCLKTAVE